MKKLLILGLFIIFAQYSAQAIDWVEVVTPKNRIAYLDIDSITEYKNYYFYNIKFQNPNESKYTILTMQSAKSSPMSARIKAYTEEEYKSLNGDYENITKEVRQALETVTYESVVNTCYKKVKEIKANTANNIILGEEETIEE